MNAYVALLRAVNVGGTGKLPMSDLVAMCQDIGFSHVQTYIASGNVVFHSHGSEQEARSALEERLHAYAGKAIGVCVRTADDLADIVARNPFASEPGNRVLVLFTDSPLPDDPYAGVKGHKSEQICLGKREIFVHYPDGMATSRLRIPSEASGTARNMNSVAKLAEMARALSHSIKA